jgi:hypothetical protein
VYVETLLAGTGPVVAEQLVTPGTPVIDQIPSAVGAAAPVGPATVAVKVIVEPSGAEAEFALTATVGVDAVTVVS